MQSVTQDVSEPLTYLITNLQPSTEYVIRLRAFNRRGEGLSAYDFVTTADQAPPGKTALSYPKSNPTP